MAEYIEREETCKGCVRYGMGETLCADCVVKAAPAADVAPVVHGRWVGSAYDFCCSACGVYQNFYTGRQNYCPNCGARMDGE